MAISIGNKQSKASIGDKEVKTLDVDFDDVIQRVYNIDEDFSYDGEVKQIPIIGKGKLALKVWGGKGNGGRNPGYAEGKLNVKEEDERLIVRVGGNGNGQTGGFNGGGNGVYNANGGGGGGATDIRIKTDSVYARVIVAGGSGGKGPASAGGSGGGPHGGRGNDDADNTGGNSRDAGGGSQTQGGTARSTGGNQGTFGAGGNASGYASGGGGGGWYGGGGAYDNDSDADGKGGGGGSGYIHTAATAVNYPAGCLLDESNYLEDAVNTKGGNTTSAGRATVQGVLKRGASVPTYITQPGVYHNPTLGLISISADGQSWITISDKNVGATVADPEDVNSNGDIFQYGNIHHFAGDGSGGAVTVSSEIPDLTGYEGGNLYSDDKYRTNIDWNAANKNLWKWIAFNLKSLGKGPCPLGFHVPSAEEWTAVMDTVLGLAGENFSYDLISKYLLMVHPNSRKGDGAFYANNTSIYLTNSYIANQNKINAFVMIGDEGSESGGLSATDMNCGGYIRPFRDEAMIPTTERTRMPTSPENPYWIDGYYEMVEDKWYADEAMTQEIEPEEFKYYRYIRYNTPVFYQYINGHFVVQKKNETTLTRNEAITLSEGNTRKEFMVWNGRGLGVIASRGSAYAHLLKRNDVNDVTIGNVISISSDLQYLYNGFHTKTGRIIAGDNGSSDNNRQLYYIDLDWNNNSITKSLAASNGSGAPFQGNMVDDENIHAYAFDNGSSGQYLRANMNDTGSGFKSTDGIKTTTTFSNICGGAWHDGRIVVQPDNNANIYFGTPVEGTDTINWMSYTHGLTRPNSVGSDRVRNVYVGSSTQAKLARGRGTKDSMSWSVIDVALNTGGQIYVDEIGDVWYEGESATGLGRVRLGEFMTAEDIIAKQTPLYDIVYENGNFADKQGHELVKTGNIAVGDHYWRVSSDINKMLFRHNSGDTYPAARPFTVMWFGKTNGTHFSSDHPTMVAFSDSANKLVFSVGFTQDNSSLQVNHLRENSAWDTATYATSNFDSSVRHHYAMTWGGEGTGSGALRVYIDGIQVTSITASGGGTGTPAPTGGLSIFGRYVDGYETESARSNCFNGDLYDVKCFGYQMLTDDIMSYLKNYGFFPQTSINTKIYIPMSLGAAAAIRTRRTRAVTTASTSMSTLGGARCLSFSNGYINLTNPFLTRSKNTTFVCRCYCTGVNSGDGKIFDMRPNLGGVTNNQIVYTYGNASQGYGLYQYPEPHFFEGVDRKNQWILYCLTLDSNNIPTLRLKGSGVNVKMTHSTATTNFEAVPDYMNIGNEYNNSLSRYFNGGMSRLLYEHRERNDDMFNEYYDKTKWIFGIS